MDRQRYHILHTKIAKPIWEAAMLYESSMLFVENKLVNKEVIKAFNELKKVLAKQLEGLR